MDMLGLINCMGMIFLLLATGFFCNKIGILDETNKKGLSRIVINVALPAMLVDAIIGTDIDLSGPSAKESIGAIAVYYVALFIIAVIYVNITARNHPDKGVYQYMVMFSNVGFLGIPLTTSMFGQEALFHVALLNIPFNVFAFSYGILLIRGQKKGEGIPWKKIISPPAVTSLISLILLVCGVKLPLFVANAVNYIGDMTVPAAMMIVGASLATIPGGTIWKEWRVYALALLTLLGRPLVIAGLLSLFVTDPLVKGVVVILAAVPVGANTTSLCIEYKANEALTSCCLFVTTMLSMVTIPIVAMVLL